MFLWETAAMSFHPTFTTPESRQMTAPAMNSVLWNRLPAFTAERPKNTTGIKSTSAIGTLNPSGMVSFVIRFLTFLPIVPSVMVFLFCPKKRTGAADGPPRLFFLKITFYTRFHFAPPGMSVTSTPCALSSSRMRSASAKFFAFLASARWRIRFSMPSSAVPSSETTVKPPALC